MVREQPFNLKGGLWFFVSFRIRTTQELEYCFFLSRKAQIFVPEFIVRLYDQNSESHFFFPPPKSEYFFQQQKKKPYPFKLNGRSLI